MRSVHISSVIAGFTCATGPQHQSSALQPCCNDRVLLCKRTQTHADLHAPLAFHSCLILRGSYCGAFAANSHYVLLESTAQRGMVQVSLWQLHEKKPCAQPKLMCRLKSAAREARLELQDQRVGAAHGLLSHRCQHRRQPGPGSAAASAQQPHCV